VIEQEGYSEECTRVPGGEIPRESRQQILENSFRKTGAEKEKSNGRRARKGGDSERASEREGERERERESERGGGRWRKEAVEKNEIRA
jgi:hypothetical protein